MTIDLTIIKDHLEIGATLSRIDLARRLNRNIGTLQGKTIRARGETWEASYYNGGRLQGYTLLARLEPSFRLLDGVTHDAMPSPKGHVTTPPARRAAGE